MSVSWGPCGPLSVTPCRLCSPLDFHSVVSPMRQVMECLTGSLCDQVHTVPDSPAGMLGAIPVLEAVQAEDIPGSWAQCG